MKTLIIVAFLLVSASAAASKHVPTTSHAKEIQYCGPMGEESMECVTHELTHGRPAMVSVECDDGAAGMVRVWIDDAGEIQFYPSTRTEACK